MVGGRPDPAQSMNMPARRLASAEFPYRLQQHQRAAIRAYEASPDPSRCRIVLPPGAGKTLIAAEIARRAGRKTLIIVPNTAAQGQWVQQWQLLGTGVVTIAEDRALTADVTVLTYAAIATFADDDPSDSDRVETDDSLAQRPRLHPDTTDFWRRLTAGPPLTLIIDEAHLLAGTPGDLLEDALAQVANQGHDLPAPIVIALSAIPGDLLAPYLQEVADRLFGPVLFTVSTPSLIRDQALAPYRDLVRFAPPTEVERNYLKRSAVGRNPVPDGARHDESLVDQVLKRSAAKADSAVSILKQEWASRGPSMRAAIITDDEAGAAMPTALSEVLSSTAGSAREALTLVVDALPETSPVLVTETTVAGSTETMNRLIDFIANGNPNLAGGLRPAPMPGSEGIVSLSGPGWRPRVWLPIVTGWFLAGGTRVLVGTRDALGEGWDGASLNVLVDLTSATQTSGTNPGGTDPSDTRTRSTGAGAAQTGNGEPSHWENNATNAFATKSSATSMTTAIQIRGRALRKDPADPRKSANIWSVVVVNDDHPLGGLDYRRFVHKLAYCQGADPAGRILAGVAHVDPECDTLTPPDPKMRTEINNRMMAAAARLEELPRLWGIGQSYADVNAPVIQVRGFGGDSLDLDVPQAALRPWAGTRGMVPAAGASVGALLPILSAAPPVQALIWASVGGVSGWGADAGSRWVARRRAKDQLSAGDTILAIGKAVAQSLGLDPHLVEVSADGDGVWLAFYSPSDNRMSRENPDQAEFVAAMEQVLSPVNSPNYLISRQLPKKGTEVWHMVPDNLGRNQHSAAVFLEAWVEFVSDADLVDTNGPEGAAVLESVRGLNPCNVWAGRRVAWR